MTLNHNTNNVYEIIGLSEEDLEHYFEFKVWENYDLVRNDYKVTDKVLAEILVHLVGVEEKYNEIILPLLGAIYGYKSKEFKEISSMDFSYQLEAIIEYCDEQLRGFIGGYYVMSLLENSNEKQ